MRGRDSLLAAGYDPASLTFNRGVFATFAMEDEWTKVISGGRLVKFTYEDFASGVAFLTAQLARHEVVYTVILLQAERPYSRQTVEGHFAYELRPFLN